MLKISKLADYATVLMDYLARHPEPSLSAAILAEKTKIPVASVSKILKLLTKAELLSSERGAMGGYRLAKPAMAISIADVITAIEGTPALTECSQAVTVCSFDQCCYLRGNWRLINQVVFGVLGNISLAAMGRPLTANEIPMTFHPKKKSEA